ncbi:hypothetical protein HETIRDRAFT_148610, partial [Heterobasidion irregulare TC 32-1]
RNAWYAYLPNLCRRLTSTFYHSSEIQLSSTVPNCNLRWASLRNLATAVSILLNKSVSRL